MEVSRSDLSKEEIETLELVYLWLATPLLLMVIAWTRPDRLRVSFTALTLSALLILLATIRPAKWTLLGPDYSHRLYAEIETNLLVAVLLAVYLAIRHRWIAATAGLALTFTWLYVGVVNSVV
jgi:hypothetical protein